MTWSQAAEVPGKGWSGTCTRVPAVRALAYTVPIPASAAAEATATGTSQRPRGEVRPRRIVPCLPLSLLGGRPTAVPLVAGHDVVAVQVDVYTGSTATSRAGCPRPGSGTGPAGGGRAGSGRTVGGGVGRRRDRPAAPPRLAVARPDSPPPHRDRGRRGRS